MAINERPGVYSSVEVSSRLSGSNTGKTIGIAAISSTGTKGVCTSVTSYGEAVSLYGADCNLTKLIKVLLQNGAAAIEAVPVSVGAEAATADYTAAFAVLTEKENVTIMLCDSRETVVFSAMKTAIEGASENCKYRIGIVEGAGTVAEVAAKAGALNSERMVIAYPAIEGSGALLGSAAAALAGVVSTGRDPALPVNGAELNGLDNFLRIFSDTEINSLVQAGVTPIESVYGSPCVVRGVTTRTKTEATYTSGSGKNVKTVSNPCAYNGQTVADWLLACYNRRVNYKTPNRGNPAVEIGDTITIYDAYGANGNAAVTNIDLNYNGGLAATTQGVR